MLKAFEFCIPGAGKILPAGTEWLREIKGSDKWRVQASSRSFITARPYTRCLP